MFRQVRRRTSSLRARDFYAGFVAPRRESAALRLESGRLAHLVTMKPVGSPQVAIVWMGLDGDEIAPARLGAGQKMGNLERDARVALSVEGAELEPPGLQQYS